MSSYAGKIKVNSGTFSETCVLEADLVANQLKYPAVRNMIEHVDQRALSTLLVSGSVGKYGVGHVDTKYGKLADKGKDIGNNAYRFDVQGRIQQASTINSQIGATTADGVFVLSMFDNYIVPGMHALFHGQGFQARCMGNPTGSAGNYIYTFQSPDGVVFNWTTHVAGQGSTKTCHGGHTSYGEASLRGYGRSHFADSFITHTTTQRKTIGISGDANSDVLDVLWLEWEDKGVAVKGWMYAQIQQAMAQMTIEDEFNKWFGISDMKNTDGSLRTTPRLIDSETGRPITTGDGLLAQLEGGNELFGSGVNGEATEDDFEDMMSMLEKKSNGVKGMTWVCVTGTDGYANAQRKMINLAGNSNTTVTQHVTQTGEAGGASVDIGFNYNRFNINGNSIVFVKFPLFDDEQRFTERGSDGKILQSSMYVFLNLGNEGSSKNIEILSKGGNGSSRGNVSQTFNGMTGDPSTVATSEEDAKKYAVLKQDLIVCYNTSSAGVIRKNS